MIQISASFLPSLHLFFLIFLVSLFCSATEPDLPKSNNFDLNLHRQVKQFRSQSPPLQLQRISTSPSYKYEWRRQYLCHVADKSAKIFVAGHCGLVGSAIVRKLESLGFTNLVLRTHAELDLTRQSDVEAFFASEKPQFVILAAAKVGGIHANNTYPADFIALNLQIQTNVIDASHRFGVTKLLFLGSSCIYPKFAPQPIPESALLTGPLEPTNEWYAIAKIAGIKMCQAYRIQYNWDAISGMPTNLYGPHDNFHPENSHVLPALMRRFHEAKVNGAKEVVVWGSGSPLREFLHVDDLADAVVFLMQNYSELEHVNVGSGKEVTIKELAELVKEVVGFQGQLLWDLSKPDGTPRKLMDSSKLAGLGWTPEISLKDGLVGTYKWYLEHVKQ